MFKIQTFPSYFKRAAVAVLCFCIVFWATIPLRPRVFIYNVKPFVLFDDKPSAPKYAFATILTAEGDVEYPDVGEPYLKAARLLTYQPLHNPRTRNGSVEIPLLVLVTPDVPQNHRDILKDDGATIVPVESLGRDWILSIRFPLSCLYTYRCLLRVSHSLPSLPSELNQASH